MLIDWFTVAAQALNFLVLVWLMKRVLYQPIMKAIDSREALVAAELSDAAAKSASAESALKDFQHKNEAFDQDRAALITTATADAKAQAAQLLDGARSEGDVLRVKQRTSVEREMQEFKEGVARRAQQAFFSLARRAFMDLANVSLEEQVTARFCERLRTLKVEDRAIIAKAVKTSLEPLTVRVAFPLTADALKTLQTAINDTFDADIPVRVEVAPQLISGIELTAQGQRVSWSISDYLASLEKEVSATMARPPTPLSDSEATAKMTPSKAPVLLAAS